MRGRIVSYASTLALVGLAALVVALGGLMVVREPKAWIEIVGAVGVALLAVSILLRPQELRAALTGRQARYGGNAVLMTVAFILIIGLVNYMGSRTTTAGT